MMARKRPSGQNRRIQQAFVTGRMNGIIDLFDYMREKTQETEAPLASRMRPSALDEVVVQQHII